MFQRRHYKAIAEVLKANHPCGRDDCMMHRCIVDQLANLFAQDNSRFDWDKFFEACGIKK